MLTRGAHSDRTQPLVSACLIVRDEEKNLLRCLQSLVGFADEVIVHDTGSRDSTVEIAREFGARVFEETWRNDFAYHRNRALEQATGKWCTVIDADEELVDTDIAAVRERLEADEQLPDILLVVMDLLYDGQEKVRMLAPRLLRSSAGIRFSGAIHENLDVHDADGLLAPIHFRHHGYLDPVQLKEKEQRNLYIALRALATEPSAHLHHCVARAAYHLGEDARVLVSSEALLKWDGASHVLRAEGARLGAMAAVRMGDESAVGRFMQESQRLDASHPDHLLLAVTLMALKYRSTVRRMSNAQSVHPRVPLIRHDAAIADQLVQLLTAQQSNGPELSTEASQR